MKRLVLMAISLMLLAAINSRPADARSARQPGEAWDNLKNLSVGEEIQVDYGRDQYLNGRFRGFTREGITVQWGQVNLHDETIPRQEVVRIIASRPSARLKNALAGLGGGALVGLGIAGDMVHSDSGEAGAVFAAGVTVVGAIAGAVAGALSSPDATIYEALQVSQFNLRLDPKQRPTSSSVSWPSSSGPLIGCPRCDAAPPNHVGRP